MSHEKKYDWATNRVDAAISKVYAEHHEGVVFADDRYIRQAIALELRKVAAECAAIVVNTDTGWLGASFADEGDATLLSAAARIRAAFPDREGA